MWVSYWNRGTQTAVPRQWREQLLVNVLVVDDSAAIRDRLVEMVSDLEGTVQAAEAQNGWEAVAYVRDSAPDVVILDLRMPGLNGFDVLKQIKRLQSCPVVIMLTNYASPRYERKCTELGADYFLDKATQFTAVPELLRSLAGGGDRRGQLR
jgi:CheY-like chemotaxis protein